MDTVIVLPSAESDFSQSAELEPIKVTKSRTSPPSGSEIPPVAVIEADVPDGIESASSTMLAPLPSVSEGIVMLPQFPDAKASVILSSSQSPNDGAAESVTVLPPVNLSVPVPPAMSAGMVWAKLPVSNTAGAPVTLTVRVAFPAKFSEVKTSAFPATIFPLPQLKVWLWQGWNTKEFTCSSPPVRLNSAVEERFPVCAPSQKFSMTAVPPDMVISTGAFWEVLAF